MSGKKTRKVATKGSPKKQEVKKNIEKKEAKILDFLKPEHLLKIEQLGAETVISKQAMHITEQSLANKNLELKILERDIEVTKRLLAQKQAIWEGALSKKTNFINSIVNLYNFGKQIAYDPESGKVIREKK